MKSVMATIVLSSFIAVAVFGFLAMMHSGTQGHQDCIAATAKSAVCPIKLSANALVPFHIDTYKSFSTATVSMNIVAMLAFIYAFVLLIATKIVFGFSFSRQHILSIRLSPVILSSAQRSLKQWLARHENSPSFR